MNKQDKETESLVTTSTRSQNRRPYHYSPYGTVIDETISTNSSMDYWSERANYSRYLYYSRLRRAAAADADDDMLLIPPHVVPSSFYYPPFVKTHDGKQSSLVTIFTVWNTMMGTSLLSMPWAMERAGIVPSIVLLVGMAAISFYTAYRILEVYENNESSKIQDLAILCKRLLGRWAQVLAIVFSVLTLLGAAAVYWVLMSNFIYRTVDYIYNTATSNNQTIYSSSTIEIICPSQENISLVDTGADNEDADFFHKIWNLYSTVPLFLAILLVPIISIRSPTFFAKFNSLGTLSVVYITTFVFVKVGKFGINVTTRDPDSPSYTPLYKPNFAALSGMLSLAYFIHNCIVTIMKNNRHPQNNKRDLGISFVFVAITYFIIGGTFYLMFPLDKSCIEDNFLENFKSFDVWTVVARIFLFFQILTVYPLIVYILRVQVCYAITKAEPSVWMTFFSNSVIVAICISFAIWLPKIGTIIRFTGALCGLVYSFLLPVCLYLVWKRNLNVLNTQNTVAHVLLFLLGLANFIAQFIVSP